MTLSNDFTLSFLFIEMIIRPTYKIQLDERSHMRAFDYSSLYEKAWDTDTLNLIAMIYE